MLKIIFELDLIGQNYLLHYDYSDKWGSSTTHVQKIENKFRMLDPKVIKSVVCLE